MPELYGQSIGANLHYQIKDRTLIITIPDVTKNFGPSHSGKTLKVASTGGNTKIPEVPGIFLNININRVDPSPK